MALFHFLAQLAADLRGGLAALLVGRRRLQGRTGVGRPSSFTATMVKKQLLAWRTLRLRMSSATTLMPISIDEVPVWFTDARKVTSSPTAIGWRNITWSTDRVTT